MLKRVVITNYRGESIVYRIGDAEMNIYGDKNWTPPETSGLLITSIDGLGPVKANINMTELTTTDGGRFNSARLSTRNIVIKARFLHATSIEEARLLSYKYFPIKKKLTIRIETDNRTAETEGYVESNEPDIFSDECECQISVLCESAFFNAVGEGAEQIIRFSSVEPLFKFPFGNPSLNERKIKIGEFISKRDSIISYNGDSENGLTLKIHFYGNVGAFTIYNVDAGEKITIDPAKLPLIPDLSESDPIFINGDEIDICTIQGRKSIYLHRGGIAYNILNLLDKNSAWFKIFKGDNRFVYETETEAQAQFIELIIVAGVIYEGV